MASSKLILLPVSIIQEVSPVCYLAIWANEDNTQSFREFEAEFNEYFRAVELSLEARPLPEKGKIVAVRNPVNQRWYRARVKFIMERIKRLEVLVFLLDFAKEINVSLEWVREVPLKFLEYPYRSCVLILSGLVPCSIILEHDLSAKIGQVNKWDQATIEFVNRIIKARKSAKVEVVSQDEDEHFNVKLYLSFGSEVSMICLNDALVNRRFAQVAGGNIDDFSHRKRRPVISSSMSSVNDDMPNLERLTMRRNNDDKFLESDSDEAAYRGNATAPSCNTAERFEAIMPPPLVIKGNRDTPGHVFEFCEGSDEDTRAVQGDKRQAAVNRNLRSHVSPVPQLNIDRLAPRSPRFPDDRETPMHQQYHPNHVRSAHQEEYMKRGHSSQWKDLNVVDKEATVDISRQPIDDQTLGRDHFRNQGSSPSPQSFKVVSQRQNSHNHVKEEFSLKTRSTSTMMVSNPTIEGNKTEHSFVLCEDSGEYVRAVPSVDCQTSVNNNFLPPVIPTRQQRKSTQVLRSRSSTEDRETPKHTQHHLDRWLQRYNRNHSDRINSRREEDYAKRQHDSQSINSNVVDNVATCDVYRQPNNDFKLGSNGSGNQRISPSKLLFEVVSRSRNSCRDAQEEPSSKAHCPPLVLEKHQGESIQCQRANAEQEQATTPTSRMDPYCVYRKEGNMLRIQSSTVDTHVHGNSLHAPCLPGPSVNESIMILRKERMQPKIPCYAKLFRNELDIVDQSAGVRRILVCGPIPTKPLKTMDEARFDSFVKSRMADLGFRYPSTIQAYVWPAITLGRNIAVVSGPRSGQTVAYLLPLISNIKYGGAYADIEKNNEPLALILCATWTKVASIYNAGVKILAGHPSVKLLHVHSGNYENQIIELTNGCDILVATPCALLKLLDTPDGINPTGFSRLCHLILDDADILTDTFKEQVKEVFLMFAKEVKLRKRCVKGNQIMTFSNKWTDNLNGLVKTVMSSPLLFCSAFCESMVYAGIGAVVHTFTPEDRLQRFLDDVLKPYLARNSGRIVISVEKRNNAQQLYNALNALPMCKNLLLINHRMEMSKLLGARAWWINSQNGDGATILIMTDGAVEHLGIEDADCLFHYDVPDRSKARFARRFTCLLKRMRRSEVDSAKNPESSVPSSVTHMVVTYEQCHLASSLIALLKRVDCHIPQSLVALMLGLYEAKEEEKEPIQLCYYLKAFGKCTNHYSCPDRHLLLKAVDAPSNWLLRGGHVRFHVTCVRSPSRLFGRIVDFKGSDDLWTVRDGAYLSLVTSMALHYAHPEHRIPLSRPKLGDVGVVAVNSVFYRVKVLYKEFTHPDKKTREVQVFFLDEGFLKYVLDSQLLCLPENLTSIPQQAYEIFLCNIGPVDYDLTWTNNAHEFVESLIAEKEMMGKVQLSMGHTLWLAPLAKMTKLKLSNEYIREFELHHELLSKGYAMEIPDHLSKLETFCRTVFLLSSPIQINEYSIRTTREPQPLDAKSASWAFLPVDEMVDVCLSCIAHPGRFYLQRFSFAECIDDLMEEIQAHVKDCPYKGLSDVYEGLLCLSPMNVVNEYYRAAILKVPDVTRRRVTPDECVTVFFVDYGDTCELKVGNLLPLPTKFLWKLPLQAIECNLAGIGPINGDEWSEDASNVMKNISMSDGNWLMMAVEVKKNLGRGPIINNNRYSVVLYDEMNYDIADELVLHGHAKEEDGSSADALNSVTAGIEEIAMVDKTISDMDISVESRSIVSSESENGNNENKTENDSKPIQTQIPLVRWSDRLDKLSLKFMIANVQEHSINVNGSTINYSATANGIDYAVQLELFDEVTKEGEMEATDTHVRVTFKKTTHKRWIRLVSKMEKLRYVSVDYDTWLGSSDEEDELNAKRWHAMYRPMESTKSSYSMAEPEPPPRDAWYESRGDASSSDDSGDESSMEDNDSLF